MKKVIMIILVLVFAFGLYALGENENQEQTLAKNKENIYATSVAADAAVPVPQLRFFVERKTLAQWAERWDKPSIVTYLYLFCYGNCIGYYVCNGKPAATTNYLVPESQNVGKGNYTYVQEQTMDLDGTYGANNPGIRFFTASGIAVEWAGAGATYLYSDAPLPLNVPKLGE